MTKSKVIEECEDLLRSVQAKPNPEKLREVLNQIDTRPNLVPLPVLNLGEEKVVVLPDGRRVMGEVREVHDFINQEGKAERKVGFKILREIT